MSTKPPGDADPTGSRESNLEKHWFRELKTIKGKQASPSLPPLERSPPQTPGTQGRARAAGRAEGPYLRMHSVWVPLHVRLARQVRVVEPWTW